MGLTCATLLDGLSSNCLENLSIAQVHVLNVSSNWISTLSFASSCVANQLIIVDFSYNRIENLQQDLHTLPFIRQLSLSNNRLSTLYKKSLYKCSLLQQLELNNNALDVIEDLPETLIHINLANNHLTIIPPPVALLPHLVSLNLSHNSINENSPTACVSDVLESIDLSWNHIKVLPTRLFPYSVSSVTHLHLESNMIADLEPLEFMNYTRLQTLNLASNKIRHLRDGVFAGIYEFSSLLLSNNSIETVGPEVFADLSIGVVDLSYNELAEIPMAIGRLFSLKKINLSHNNIKWAFGFYFFFHGFQFHHFLIFRLDFNYADSGLESLSDTLSQASAVRLLDVSRNSLDFLQWNELPPRLEHLIADSNVISLLGAASRSKLVILNDITIKCIWKAASTFSMKTAMRSLDLSDNRLSQLRMESLVTNGVNSIDLNLKGNSLKCGCELHWMTMTGTLKRRVNVIDKSRTQCTHTINGNVISLDEVEAKDLLCDYTQVCEPECVCCQFGNCDCKAVCPLGCSCFHDASFETNIVRCENLTEQQMQEFTPSAVPMSATHVYISGLKLPILRSHSFLGRPRLEFLHINASGIRGIQSKAFNTLPNLKLLDLSDNRLVRLSGDEFHKTTSVSHLFLNGNRLKSVEKGLTDKLPSLIMMTLHNNELTDISPALASSHVDSLSLSGNAFRCDCSPRFSAPTWIHQNRAKVVDIAQIYCVENITESFRNNDTTVLSAYRPNIGHDIFTMPMDEFLRDFNLSICVPLSSGFFGQEPQNSILTIVFLASCLFLLCAMVFLGISVVRKAQNDMSQRRYKASSSLNCSSTPRSSPLPVPLLNFDAFVSYSKKDEKMVLEQLCRPLEDEEYTLCLLHRDGPTYHSRLHAISDELISQMEASQCLVIILTKNFLESEWKTLQIKTSHQLFAKNRSKRIIAILGDGVDQNLLDEELGQILRKNTCIRQRDHLFWQLLHNAMPTQLSSIPSSGDTNSQIYSDMYGIVPSAVI
ncbi:leucine Rich repeat-containing domain protein [Dictyocaulus viviparus]|uniref:Leucine Rich repeat-containing domain protein n=1 Tax=Dictyocaulus viviparus TaxID=29172 RepID=A0A0D8XL69_DICVI|nr:leucine Rich repeat-containing domain protein [Dictyocaulus viviparus]